MRSLSEKYSGAPQNRPIGKDVRIHVAGGNRNDYSNESDYIQAGKSEYAQYHVNPLFGLPGEIGFQFLLPTALLSGISRC